VSSHSLTPQQVRDIALLARLELSDSEQEAMARQLGAIVDYVAQLQEVPTDGVEPLAHALPVSNVFREDEPAESLPVDQALANAPDRRRNARGEPFYGVPAVLE
jgi:aspartyl-tRNA(Asn)/glutamyl-tRNA(Gln) amidotransferase subunit C